MNHHHYGILITEDNLALILFLNDGVKPKEITDKMMEKWSHYFIFTIGDNSDYIVVGKDCVKTDNSLWRNEYFRKYDRVCLM